MQKPDRPGLFSISSRGIATALASITLLFLGVSRGELVATLCGIFLSAFLLYSLSLVAIARLLWGSSTISFGWGHGVPKAFLASVQLRGKSRMAISIARFFFEIDYRTGKDSKFSISIALDGITNESFPALPARGYYEGSIPLLRIADYPGFFSFRVPQNQESAPERLIVIPEPLPVQMPYLPVGKTGIVRGKGVFNRSDDLFDARPYQIGDDPRKINWKLYAHTGNLAVRQGDLLPPPSSEFLFIINSINQYANRPAIRDAFDSLIARIAYIAEALINERRIVSLRFYGHDEARVDVSIDPSDPAASHHLLNHLANVTLTAAGTVESMIRTARPTGVAAVFVSLPTLTFQDAKALSEQGIQLTLLGPSSYFTQSSAIKSHVMDSLFLPERSSRDGKGAPGQFRFPETLTLLTKEGVHAEEI